ncbi:TolC family protein [Haliangium sp.]|uniref:TolC family protein n=1 Tax=Haliangium sp. TaxID=2663208 RepID=UPI003D0E2CA2
MSVGLTLAAGTARAQALPSLDRYLRAGAAHNLDVRQRREQARQLAADRAVARARLLPRLTATATYTRNSAETVVPVMDDDGTSALATITPRDQVDAGVGLSVPVFDLSTWSRSRAATYAAEAGALAAEGNGFDVAALVVQAYYQYIAASAQEASARRAATVAGEHRVVVAANLAAGRASELDLERAGAEVARAHQHVADAALARANAARSLRTLTGLDADGSAPALPSGLDPEGPLEGWLGRVHALPDVRAEEAEARAAEARAQAALMEYLPTVTATATVRTTNAAGFGDDTTWAAGVTAQWSLDAAVLGQTRSSRASAEVARLRAARTRRDQGDRIEDAWNQVEALRAKSAAAEAERQAGARAAVVTRGRYRAGLATQLELIQTERDAFTAEMSHIQALADLAAARALLRVYAGRMDEIDSYEEGPR